MGSIQGSFRVKSFTTTELRHKTAELLAEAARDVVVITHRNKPTAAVLSWEAFEALLDTFDVLIEPHIEEKVRQGISEFYSDKVRDWEETKAKLGLSD